MPVNVRNADIDISEKNALRIKSSTLATALVRSKETKDESDITNVLKLGDPSFSLDKVRINSSGTVVIDSPALYSIFKNNFENVTARQLMADNGICGAGCKEK